ncbi:MAG: hypothetical protein HZA83_01005 [Thaumarchaeota archaeon]|nr:hypothetical protein [Nitrososphaerota archaeon]
MVQLPDKTPELVKELNAEVRELVRLGLNHSALAMMNVLIEASLKELYKIKHGKYPDGASFGKTIYLCRDEKIINDKEVEWLKKMNHLVRNSYLHHDVEKLARNAKVAPEKLDAKKKKDFDMLVAVELFAEVEGFVVAVMGRNLSSE